MRLRGPTLSVALVVLLQVSCAYRFTNSHIDRPDGIRSIAVEAVFDTTGEVLPHEHLWTSLQQAFARDGNLRLVSRTEADAIVRAHIKTAEVRPTGDTIPNPPLEDPKTEGRNLPPKPQTFKKLTQAGEIRDSVAFDAKVDIEVWGIKSRRFLMRRSYALKGDFRAVQAPQVTLKVNDHLRYDEAFEAQFKAASRQVAEEVVRDLLVR